MPSEALSRAGTQVSPRAGRGGRGAGRGRGGAGRGEGVGGGGMGGVSAPGRRPARRPCGPAG
ncbi:hypothetical protein B4U78_000560 [Microbacterium esteraromaticum]|nr:hypothetical protein B4U78_000560 [Microbacterium esteraromaticum]